MRVHVLRFVPPAIGIVASLVLALPSQGSDTPRLAAQDTTLYWQEQDGNDRQVIGRASVDGKSVERRWLDLGPLGAFQLAAGSGTLFWTWGGTAGAPSYIGRASLDGRILSRRFVRGSTADVGP